MGSEDEDDTLAKLVPPPKPMGFLEGALAALDRVTKKKDEKHSGLCTCEACYVKNTGKPKVGSPVAAKPLSPHLEKNKYHDVLLDKVADFAVSVGAPMDIVVELHPDTKAAGYVVRLVRGEGKDQGVITFKLGVEDMVQPDQAKLESQVLAALHTLTGKEYKKPPTFMGFPHPIPAAPWVPTTYPAGPRPTPVVQPAAHNAACVCGKCKKKPKPQAGPVPADQTLPDVPLAKRYIDPTKVLDMGDRVLDLE